MDEKTQFDWQVRRHVYDVAMHRGYPPLVAEISHELDLPLETVETALQHLAAGRVLVRQPDTGEILMQITVSKKRARGRDVPALHLHLEH